jgi:F-type H+-transporting ATPase subunit b
MTTTTPRLATETEMLEIQIKKMRTKNTTPKNRAIRAFIFFGLTAGFWIVSPRFIASAQQQPVAQKSDQVSSAQARQDQAAKEKSGAEQPAAEQNSKAATEATPAEHHPTSIAGELAKETREAEGEDQQEDNVKLKHSTMVQKLAKLTGMSVHGAHIFALILNFIAIVILLVWALRKTIPGIMRGRDESIQRALDEARKASQEAGQRLADIENRLRQMDVEIGRMQASAEKEAEAEEARIKQAAEDDMQKVVQAAKQEIEAAAKQIRRELSIHTSDLALALARKQINVDPNTDQVLVRNFAAKLAEPMPQATPKSTQSDNGKDGR